mmetsp:Transcript_22596/g.65105  ORF Transcript_22596/g.65105 Transcript_22596/m.65105 type:complete len:448 (-) Transcript_22596:93-1436(-)
MWAALYRPGRSSNSLRGDSTSASSAAAKRPSVGSGSSSDNSSPLGNSNDVGETGALVDNRETGKADKFEDSEKLEDFENLEKCDKLSACADQEVKVRWRRDLLVFLLGSLAGALLLFLGGGTGGAARPGAEVRPCLATPPELNLSAAGSRSGHRYAFVQMAHDQPGTAPTYIWQVMAMAKALKRFSVYPLVLLTNDTQLPDGTDFAGAFTKLNVQVLPVHEVQPPEGVRHRLKPESRMSYWKLQIWRLEQFDKLIWLDADSILVRSIDWLFERLPMWSQRDNLDCGPDDDAHDGLSTGLMLISPSEETFQGLQRYAANTSSEWWTHGDRKLIWDYFKHVVERPVRLLDVADASYGKCLGRTPNIPYESPGPWNVPAFVHRSSWNNACFFPDLGEQQAMLNGAMVNICNYHPLGSFWRDLFCDAAKKVGVKVNLTEVFCDDYRWYGKH